MLKVSVEMLEHAIITHTYVHAQAWCQTKCYARKERNFDTGSTYSNAPANSWRAFCPFFTRPQPKIGVSFNESNAYMSQMVSNEIDSLKEEEEKQEMASITLNFTSNTFAYISFLQRSI
uniref:Uncharacterized protein n=1 Tax=Glossina pallidipes TaxID=7398 RepID=A0A1A9ZU15_GLOPL